MKRDAAKRGSAPSSRQEGRSYDRPGLQGRVVVEPDFSANCQRLSAAESNKWRMRRRVKVTPFTRRRLKRHREVTSGDELVYGFSATTLPFFQK